MFTPRELDLERGWPGRLDGDRVIQLAAQTLQSFFTGGGTAREHAEYPLADVKLLAPVLHPPSVRLFEEDGRFSFANPAAIVGPDAVVALPEGAARLSCELRLAAVIGDGAVNGVTLLAVWVAQGLPAAKDRDFALQLGPAVVTPDELGTEAVARVNGEERARGELGADWDGLVAIAARNTVLYPGDLIAAPPGLLVGPVAPKDSAVLEVDGIGALSGSVE